MCEPAGDELPDDAELLYRHVHPQLVAGAPGATNDEAVRRKVDYRSLDTFTLERDLPRAVAMLGL